MEDRKKTLLVEGKNDKLVIEKLMEVGCNSLSNKFEIKDCGGNEEVLRSFKMEISNPMTHASIGLILDADEKAQTRMEAIKEKLKITNAYKENEIILEKDGLVLIPTDEKFPQIGIWIMPNNYLPGMLEDFLLNMVDKDDKLLIKSEEVLQTLEQDDIHRYTKAHRSKAKIHTYLAWQDEPGKPLSIAVKSKILNPESESSKIFLAWLKRLFCNTNN